MFKVTCNGDLKIKTEYFYLHSDTTYKCFHLRVGVSYSPCFALSIRNDVTGNSIEIDW